MNISTYLKILTVCLTCILLLNCGGGGDDASDAGNGGGGNGGGDGGGNDTSYSLPDLATASIIVDINNDGNLDIIVGVQDGTDTSDIVLMNDGDCTFTKQDNVLPDKYLGANSSTVNFALADFNNDDRIDIIATTVDARADTFYATSKIHIYLNDGDGTFSDASQNITSGDLEGWPEWIRTGDFDADGNMDFMLTVPGCPSQEACYGGRIYLNDGNTNFAPAEISATDAERTYTGMQLEWESDGNTSNEDSSWRNPLDAFVADLNNDGKPDIVAPNSSAPGPIATFINTSTAGSLTFNIVYTVDQSDPYATQSFKNGALLDINNDGDLDMVGSWSISGQDGVTTPLYAFLNQGDGTFTLDNSVFSPSQPGVEHARQWLTADFDLNGATDLFVADHGYDFDPFPGEQNLLLLNDAASTLENVTAANLSTASTFTHGASVGDLNGDGYPDLFLNQNTDLNSESNLWINNGDGSFTETTLVIDLQQ